MCSKNKYAGKKKEREARADRHGCESAIPFFKGFSLLFWRLVKEGFAVQRIGQRMFMFYDLLI